jgi:hypothetical protein
MNILNEADQELLLYDSASKGIFGSAINASNKRMIKILQRKQIDSERWDRVIASSADETIYPYTWYLDACADNWLGLVMNDYECIMPVAYRKKIGIKYSYQPIYCQQLGVYSKEKVDNEVSRMFLHTLKKNFHLGDYSFNEGNLLGEEDGFDVTDNCNYVLPLLTDIGEIQKNFTENCRRNINRTKKSRLNFVDDISVDEIVTLKRLGEKVDRKPEHYDYIRKLFTSLLEAGKIKIYGAKEGEHLVAAVVFAFSKTRAIYLVSASSEIGKEQRAMFLVLDEFIKMHAGQDIKLDFEGSNIASIARFFRGFGAKPELYQRVSFENPASKIMKLIKSV